MYSINLENVYDELPEKLDVNYRRPFEVSPRGYRKNDIPSPIWNRFKQDN